MTLLLLTAGVLVRGAAPAAACSCMRIGDDPIEAVVARAEGAFVGTVVEVDRPSAVRQLFDHDPDGAYRLEVESVAAGAIGPEVVVRGGMNPSSCGLSLQAGHRVGLFVSRQGDHWSAGLCSTTDADELAAIGRPPDPAIRAPREPPVDAPMALGLVVVAAACAVVVRSRLRTRNDPAPS